MSAGRVVIDIGAALDQLSAAMKRAHLAYVRLAPYFEEGPYDPWRPNVQANINTRCSLDQVATGQRYPCPSASPTSD